MEWQVVESIARSYISMAASHDYGISRDGKRRFNGMLTDPIYAEHVDQLRALTSVTASTVVKPCFTMGTLSPDGGAFYKQSSSGVMKSAPIGKDRAIDLAIGILRDAGWRLVFTGSPLAEGSSVVGEKSDVGRDGWVNETPAEGWYRNNPKGK
jgi:hypothetical protein